LSVGKFNTSYRPTYSLEHFQRDVDVKVGVPHLDESKIPHPRTVDELQAQ